MHGLKQQSGLRILVIKYARDELESHIKAIFGCKTQTGFVDVLNPQMDICI